MAENKPGWLAAMRGGAEETKGGNFAAGVDQRAEGRSLLTNPQLRMQFKKLLRRRGGGTGIKQPTTTYDRAGGLGQQKAKVKGRVNQKKPGRTMDGIDPHAAALRHMVRNYSSEQGGIRPSATTSYGYGKNRGT